MDALLITGDGASALAPEQILEAVSTRAGLVWVDIDHSEEAGLLLLADIMRVEELDLEECHLRSPLPKLHVYPDHHFSAINGLARGDDGRLYFQPLKTFLNDRCLFTVLGPRNEGLSHQSAHRELDELRDRLVSGALRPATVLGLIGEIRTDMLREQEKLVGQVAHQVGRIERRVMKSDPIKSEVLLQDLFALRHDLQTIRTSAAQTHESYSNLVEILEGQPAALQVDLDHVRRLRQGFAHLMKSADLERDYMQEMLDLFQTRVATELNRFVRQVTAWGTVALGCTLVTGVYGMNFKDMPELGYQYGYPIALGVMVVLAIAVLLLFRRHGWL